MSVYRVRHVTNAVYNQADTLEVEEIENGGMRISIDCDEESQYLFTDLTEEEAMAMANAILDRIVPRRLAKVMDGHAPCA